VDPGSHKEGISRLVGEFPAERHGSVQSTRRAGHVTHYDETGDWVTADAIISNSLLNNRATTYKDNTNSTY